MAAGALIGTSNFFELVAAIALAALALLALDAARQVRFKAATMIIEFNASAEDVGIQFFLDGEGWRTIEIFDPEGEEIFSAEAEGRLVEQGGGTEHQRDGPAGAARAG